MYLLHVSFLANFIGRALNTPREDLYLIDPPAHALHKPISPNKITLAGDSAGGGLCLSLLTILRDLSRPLPAGAVLISPWVDLTHSFPSILSNVETVDLAVLFFSPLTHHPIGHYSRTWVFI